MPRRTTHSATTPASAGRRSGQPSVSAAEIRAVLSSTTGDWLVVTSASRPSPWPVAMACTIGWCEAAVRNTSKAAATAPRASPGRGARGRRGGGAPRDAAGDGPAGVAGPGGDGALDVVQEALGLPQHVGLGEARAVA